MCSASRFAAQWLRLQDLDKINPDVRVYPDFDDQLKTSMLRETELFFRHIVREDRPVLDLFSADYTFVDERLAKHYRIPGVVGSQFRKVPYPDDAAARTAGARQHPDVDVTRRSNLAGSSRQVGAGSAARHAAAAPSAERAGSRSDGGGGRRAAAHGARAPGTTPREPRLRVVPSHDRSAQAWRSRISMSQARGASRTMG